MIPLYKAKFITILYLVCLLPETILISQGWAQNDLKRQIPDRYAVINTFRKAVTLNNEFKNTCGKISLEEHLEKRRLLEKYHEEILLPNLKDCIKILFSEKDKKLAFEFLRLIVSYENSADEQIPAALGKVFFRNPNLVVEAFDKFEERDQLILYRKLEFVSNAIYKDRSVPEIENGFEKLEFLRHKINGNQRKSRP